MKKFMRGRTAYTISEIYEAYKLNKFIFNNEKFDSINNIWDDDKRMLFLESIFKNFPVKPMVLQHIKPNNLNRHKAMLNIIYGGEYINSIMCFYDGIFSLTLNFSQDGFGDPKLNGLNIEKIKKLPYHINNFWQYKIPCHLFYDDLNEKEIRYICNI